MVSIENAICEEYEPLTNLLFASADEKERARTITTALNGLSIEEAQSLLSKVNRYLLKSVFTI